MLLPLGTFILVRYELPRNLRSAMSRSVETIGYVLDSINVVSRKEWKVVRATEGCDKRGLRVMVRIQD